MIQPSNQSDMIQPKEQMAVIQEEPEEMKLDNVQEKPGFFGSIKSKMSFKSKPKEQAQAKA